MRVFGKMLCLSLAIVRCLFCSVAVIVCVCVDCLAAIGECLRRGVTGLQEGREIVERAGKIDQDHECCRLQEQGAAACTGVSRTQGGLLVPHHTQQALQASSHLQKP